MYRWTRHVLSLLALGAVFGTQAAAHEAAQASYGIGRPATQAEIQAWDIDVRPDFKGLPKGSGTVDQGMDLWDATCAVCHGDFAESNTVFTPLVGGTTPNDVKTGHVAGLTGGHPSRTTMMKVPTVSTLWDYIHRAMPWDNPKSLKPDDVYALVAYMLNLAEVVPEDFTLSDENIGQVQEKMPNRNGMKFWPGLWEVDGKPDTANTACMADCDADDEPSSTLPAHARNAHGDLAAQMRLVGPVRGVNTEAPALTGTVEDNADEVRQYARNTLQFTQTPVASPETKGQNGGGDADTSSAISLFHGSACMTCHARDKRVLGPSFTEIAAKYQGQDDAVALLTAKVKQGGSGVWGAIPMPPHPALSDDDIKAMINAILSNKAQ